MLGDKIGFLPPLFPPCLHRQLLGLGFWRSTLLPLPAPTRSSLPTPTPASPLWVVGFGAVTDERIWTDSGSNPTAAPHHAAPPSPVRGLGLTSPPNLSWSSSRQLFPCGGC